MKEKFGTDRAQTELEFIVCQDCLKSGHDFLLIFQSKEIKIHLLHEAFKSLLRNVLVDVCEIEGLRTATEKRLLTGAELKFLVLETRSERNIRKENEKFQDARGRKTEFKRHCAILEPNQVLLGHSLRAMMNVFFRRHDITKSEEKEDFLAGILKYRNSFQIQTSKWAHFSPVIVFSDLLGLSGNYLNSSPT